MLTVRQAMLARAPIAAHRRTTRDGHAVCVFVCGTPPEAGAQDTRSIELFVCGVPEAERHEIGVPYEGFAELLLERASDFDASELLIELRRVAAARRERRTLSRQARSRAIRAALRAAP
jgi:hypothetical protein